jgi:DNA-binding NarL/FixJ family response regulator
MAIKLLLIEDDAVVRRMYDRTFAMAGFEVRTESDGTVVTETVELNRPDVIVMDVMMPNFNGLETLEDLKKNRKTQGVPVIMLSAYDDEKIVQKAMDLGAARYLVKNAVEPNQIVEIVKEVVGPVE